MRGHEGGNGYLEEILMTFFVMRINKEEERDYIALFILSDLS